MSKCLLDFIVVYFHDLMQCCMYVLACICSYELLSNSSVRVVSSPGLLNLCYTWKDFLGMWHSLMSQFFLFILLVLCLFNVKNVCGYIYICIHTHTYTYTYTYICLHRDCLYEFPLLPNNNNVSEAFLHTLGAVGSLDCMFLDWPSTGLRLGKCEMLDKTFYSPCSKLLT